MFMRMHICKGELDECICTVGGEGRAARAIALSRNFTEKQWCMRRYDDACASPATFLRGRDVEFFLGTFAHH